MAPTDQSSFYEPRKVGIPYEARPYCYVYDIGLDIANSGNDLEFWEYDLCETPAYFFMVTASTTAGDLTDLDYFFYNFSSGFGSAKSKLIRYNIGFTGGASDPHLPDTYCYMTQMGQLDNYNSDEK